MGVNTGLSKSMRNCISTDLCLTPGIIMKCQKKAKGGRKMHTEIEKMCWNLPVMGSAEGKSVQTENLNLFS